jgi:endonuclease-3 related protein
MNIYHQLHPHFNESKWWPAETPFEVMVGAILTQQTIWKNVEKSVQNLKSKDLLEIKALAKAHIGTIENCVRPSGFYKQKAKRIKNLARHLSEGYNGDLEAFFARDVMLVRNELLALDGIGFETADSMLLYAGSLPKFVVDAYTFRIFGRLGLDLGKNYKQAQEFFESNLPTDVTIYRNYHAYMVEVGKNHCKTRPLCTNCPLSEICRFFLSQK